MNQWTLPTIESAQDAALAEQLRAKIDGKTKPLGSLGRIEELALQLGLIQRSVSPRLHAPHILVFAADHGAAHAGVSAYPPDVTWQMVMNFLQGGAAINAFATSLGLPLTVVDAGVDLAFEPHAPPHTHFIDAKIARGTANYLETAAMSAAQCELALQRGAQIATQLHSNSCNVLLLGEMGIGNTASAALLLHQLSDLPLDACVGRGTGLNDAGLARKRQLLQQACARTGKLNDPLHVLREFGGFEIAQLVGAMLAAAARRMAIVVDGFIVSAAALVAARLEPAVLDYCVFAHCSAETAHRVLLQQLGVQPLLDLQLRLGEGTGAALAFPLLRAAEAFINDMASFDSAGVARANAI